MSVSAHVIDCVYGRPTVAMSVGLSWDINGEYHEQWCDETDDDGRDTTLSKAPLPRGSYSIELNLDSYFRKLGLVLVDSAITMRVRCKSDGSAFGFVSATRTAGKRTPRRCHAASTPRNVTPPSVVLNSISGARYGIPAGHPRGPRHAGTGPGRGTR